MSDVKRDDRGREQVKAWYALAVTSGREKVVRDRLTNLSKGEMWKDQIFRVVIPSKKEIGANGKEKEIILYNQVAYVEMILNDDTYNAVKIDGVRHILGEPTPVPNEEMEKVFHMMGIPFITEDEKPKEGDIVIISDPSKGAFYGQEGKIIGYDPLNKEYEIIVLLMGKEIHVSATIHQITKK